jgi:DNA-binding winged helix-turn-helix (wHTH) protein/Tol biopolymer transport system component
MKELAESKNSVFRFADVEVREAEFVVTRGGQPLPVEPKVMKVLLYLLHRPGRLISKDEILEAVWNDTVVSENSLTRNIAYLRHILGDDPHAPRYIATVTTVGYRFICQVEVSEEPAGGLPPNGARKYGNGDAESTGILIPDSAEIATSVQVQSAPQPADVQSAKNPPRWTIRWLWLLAAFILAIGMLAFAVWYLLRPLPPLRITSYTKLTHDGHDKSLGGTDGSRIYFTESSPFLVNQIAVTGGEIVPVPPAESLGLSEIWDVSRDGANLLISQRETGELDREMWNVRALGVSRRHLGLAATAAYSPDGDFVAYFTRAGEFRIVRSDGTQLRKVAMLAPRVQDLAWSPDGRVIRFSQDGALCEISSDGSNLYKLLPTWRPSSYKCCGRWTPDGGFFLFRSGESQLSGNQIWVLDQRRSLIRRPPAEPYQLTTGPINWDVPIPSRDGKQIFAEGRTYIGELDRVDATSHQLQPYLKGISAEFLSYSADGRSLAYVSFPDGVLWKANRDGSTPVQLTEPPLDVINPRWSPDGSRIAFADLSAGGNAAISYVVPADGGSPQRILPEGIKNQADPGWSPDGRRIIFATGPPRGRIAEHLSIVDMETKEIKTLPGTEGSWNDVFRRTLGPSERSLVSELREPALEGTWISGATRLNSISKRLTATNTTWSSQARIRRSSKLTRCT